MSPMTINVNFLAGTDISEAVAIAKRKAEFLQVAFVCFKFNGVDCSIGATANIDDAIEQYYRAIKDGISVISR